MTCYKTAHALQETKQSLQNSADAQHKKHRTTTKSKKKDVQIVIATFEMCHLTLILGIGMYF